MRYLITGLVLCCVAMRVNAQQTPDISGSYTLIKGKGIYLDDQSVMIYLRGAMVLEPINNHAFAVYGAVTPKGGRTVGRNGIYDYQNGVFQYHFPNGDLPQPGDDITFRNDTLFVIDRMENATDTLVWKRVPAARITDKYLLKQIAASREDFKVLRAVRED